MTEQEAMEEVKRWTGILMSAGSKCLSETAEAQDMAIKALGEIQQYKAIGTPDECRAAVEKQKAKKPNKCIGFTKSLFVCSACGRKQPIMYEQYYCKECGQKLDWSDVE